MIEKSARNDRHNPLGKWDYLSIQHLERYKFAIKLLKPGWLVLDIACGTGYGTAMLIDHGCHVIGTDLDSELIVHTVAKYNHKGFIIANAPDLPFADKSFDAVVSFETIEHVVDGYHFIK